MESATERFFRGFSLEDYRLQVLVKRLEKEKKQCLNRLREETHMFKMSIRPPVKCREDCWSQYGEIFHANGDKRESGSITQVNMDYNKEDDVNNTCTGTGNRDHTASNLPHHSNHHSQISSALSPNCSGVNQIVQRCYQKRRRNRGTKNKDSRKKTKPPGLSLLEILCADFENGALLAKGTESIDQSVSGLKNYLSNLDRESSNKAHRTGVDKEALHIDSDKSLKLTKLKDTNGQSCTCKSSSEVIQSGHGETLGNSNSDLSKSKSVKIEGINCNSPNESSISKLCMSSQETVALRDKSTRNLSNWTSQVFNNNCELRKNGAKPIDSQSHEGNCSKQFQRKIIEKLAGRSASLDIADRKNEKAILSHHSSWAESVGAQTSEKSRFVHFKEKRKQSKRKGKKGNCVDKSKCKEKLNRTRSSGVKLFQVDGLQSSQQRKSQEDIDKETRQKMDQFFVKVEHTKTFQTSKPRWRCTSGVDSNARRIDRKTFHEQSKRLYGGKKEHGYRRAQPWPTQVWS